MGTNDYDLNDTPSIDINKKEKKHFSFKRDSKETSRQRGSYDDTRQSRASNYLKAPSPEKRHSNRDASGLPVLKFTKALDELNFSKITKIPLHEARFSDIDEETSTLEEKSSSSSHAGSGDKKLRFDDSRRSSHAKGMRFEYGRCPKTCERFLKIEEYSKIFVDDLIEEALLKGRGFMQKSAVKVFEGFEYTEDSVGSLSITSISTYVCILEWPTIEQFTIEIGLIKINEYLSYWKFEEDWKFCVNFLNGVSDAACDFYQYEAIFSIPCKQYPIPQATATVFFTFEVSRIRPVHCLVDVYYWFEGQRIIHTPGLFTFQEEKLFNIVDAKIAFYKSIKF